MAFTDKLTPSNDEDLKQIIKDLKKDLKSLREDVGSLQKDSSKFAKDSGRFASAGAGAAQHTFEDAAEKVIKMSRETADHLREDAEHTTQSIRDTIRENPIASLGIATAIGMVLGRRILR